MPIQEDDQHALPRSSADQPALLDLRELFGIAWRGKWLIIAITFVFSVSSIIISLRLPNIYRAEALLAPQEDSAASGLGALSAQYSGLASLAGFDLGGGSSTRSDVGLEILKSRKFLFEFIDKHDALVPLMASVNWDEQNDVLQLDSELYDSKAMQWVRDVSPPKQPTPSKQEAYEAFREVMTVSEDPDSGFVRVAVEHYSPYIAKNWVDNLVSDVNLDVMQRDVSEARKAIDYLSEQVTTTSVAQMQNVFFSIIEEKTKVILLSEVSPEYLFRTIDPATVNLEKVKPKRALIVVLATLAGGVFSFCLCLVSFGRRTRV